MARSLLTIIFISVVSNPLPAQDKAKMVEYFSGWKGHWLISDAQKGSLVISADAQSKCLMVKGRFGTEGFDEIIGYDQQAKHWKTVGYTMDGESYEYVIRDFPTPERPRENDSWNAKIEGMMSDGTPTSAELKWTVLDPRSEVVLDITNAKEGNERLPDRRIEYSRFDYVEFWKPLEGDWRTTVSVAGGSVERTWSYHLANSGVAFNASAAENEQPISDGIHAFDPGSQKWFAVELGSDGSRTTMHVTVDNADEVFPLGSGSRGSYESVQIHSDGSRSNSNGDFVWKEFTGDRGLLVLSGHTGDGLPQGIEP